VLGAGGLRQGRDDRQRVLDTAMYTAGTGRWLSRGAATTFQVVVGSSV
jgi:hypothetical protein